MNAPLVLKITDLPIFQMDRPRALSVLKSSLFPGAQDASVEMVLGWCEARGVDPMDKPCHIVPMWDSKAEQMRDVIMPSVDYYRQKAESTTEYLGLSDTQYGPIKTLTVGEYSIDYPEWAHVVVKRLVQGRVAEFPAKVFWVETYATKKRDTKIPNAMWQKRPFGQLEKCAEAQALRRAFPKLCGGPTAEEMMGKALDLEAGGDVIEGIVTSKTVAMPQAKNESAHPDHASATAAKGNGSGGDADKPLTEGAKKTLNTNMQRVGRAEADLIAAGFPKIDEMKFSRFNEAMDWLKKNPAKA